MADTRLFYAIHPSRQREALPIVFIHGAGGNHLSWPAPLRWLSPVSATYLPDLPGHGRSGRISQPSLESYAASVHALCEALELSRPVMIGHSLGGAIALSLILRYPGLYGKLVLINSAARFELPPPVLTALRDDPARAVELINELAFAPDSPSPLFEASREVMLSLPADVLRADYEACQSVDLVGRLHEIRVPTLVIGAEADLLTSPEDARLLVARIPGARLVMLSDAGHMAPLTQTQAVRDALLAFLDPDGLR